MHFVVRYFYKGGIFDGNLFIKSPGISSSEFR